MMKNQPVKRLIPPPDIHRIYTVGYQGIKIAVMTAAMESIGASLMDIRMSPWSRNPEYTHSRLKGVRNYFHCKDFGNENFRSGPIKILNFGRGCEALFAQAQLTPVVMMCACWNKLICHRSTVADMLTESYGLDVIHLSKGDIKEMANPSPPSSRLTQPTMF